MTPTQAVELVKAACVKANPSIMELGFGCELLFEVEPYNSHNLHRRKDDIFVVIDENPDAKILGKFEILGRPIRLADVLLAIGKKFYFDSSFKGGISRNGGWYENGQLLAEWNLRDDDLNHASDECKLFLAGTLQDK